MLFSFGDSFFEAHRIQMTTTVPITADDRIGDVITPEEQEYLRSEILNIMIGPNRNFRRFPGAQPVSMDRTNLELLTKKRSFFSKSRF